MIFFEMAAFEFQNFFFSPTVRAGTSEKKQEELNISEWMRNDSGPRQLFPNVAKNTTPARLCSLIFTFIYIFIC